MKIYYMTHNFSDWDSQTKHMTRNQRAIYLDLRTLYFTTANANNGRIDDDFDLLCFRLACHTEQDKADLRLVLLDKFKKIGNNYRHADWDKEIKAIIWEIKKGGNTGNIQGNTNGNTGNIQGNTNGNTGNIQGNTNGNTQGNTPLTAYERKLKSEAKRQRILAELADIDVVPSDDTKMKELETLYKAHFGHDFTDGGNDIGNTGNVDGNTQGNAGNAQKPSNNHKPITNNHKPNNISPQTPQRVVVSDDATDNQKTCPTPKTDKTLNVSFETFWDLYDKKQDRPKCERLWSKLTDQERTDILVYLPKYKQAQPDKQYRKNPQTFLNNRSWENEIINSTQTVKPAKSTRPQFGGKDDPMAVNQRWENYQPPANWEENFEKAMAMVASPSKQSQNATEAPTSPSFGQNGTKVPPSDFDANLGHFDANSSTKPIGLIHI